MIKYIAGISGVVVFIGLLLFLFTGTPSYGDIPSPTSGEMSPESAEHTAVLAGGCFWGVEAVFEHLAGVESVVSGYAGGSAGTAHYNIVSSGKTGHAESVLITFNPSVISYETILKVFFSVAHDPTQLNYQGPDHGTQYRSVIFYVSPEQMRIAKAFIQTLTNKKAYSKPIVTEVTKLGKFYPAEAYHQDFMKRNPNYPYIVYWDRPKIEHLESSYPELLKKQRP